MSGKAYCLKENGELVWSTKIGEGNASFHVALDGDRFFASNRALFCLDKNNGKILWKNNDDGEKANSTFAIKGDKIYHASLGGALRCVDKTNGKCVWSHNEGLFASSCTILDERIFARTPQTNVDFRKKSVGDEKYHALSVQNNANSGINSSENLSDANLQTFKTPPQFAGGNVLLVCERDRFLFFDAQSGRLIKEYRANGVLYRAPVFASGALYIGDESGKMSRYEIDENYQMREKFSFQASGAISTNAALCDDKLYFGTEAGLVYCLDAQSGEEYFRQKSLGVARDILPGENIVILSDKGQLECYCG
ncbi:MAG: PQQ-like beta-propeller repeat protein [Campylobacter sp.]|nr:PQQ-like beta-propeller repeat protein [Campylobacter sp.]